MCACVLCVSHSGGLPGYLTTMIQKHFRLNSLSCLPRSHEAFSGCSWDRTLTRLPAAVSGVMQRARAASVVVVLRRSANRVVVGIRLPQQVCSHVCPGFGDFLLPGHELVDDDGQSDCSDGAGEGSGGRQSSDESQCQILFDSSREQSTSPRPKHKSIPTCPPTKSKRRLNRSNHQRENGPTTDDSESSADEGLQVPHSMFSPTLVSKRSSPPHPVPKRGAKHPANQNPKKSRVVASSDSSGVSDECDAADGPQPESNPKTRARLASRAAESEVTRTKRLSADRIPSTEDDDGGSRHTSDTVPMINGARAETTSRDIESDSAADAAAAALPSKSKVQPTAVGLQRPGIVSKAKSVTEPSEAGKTGVKCAAGSNQRPIASREHPTDLPNEKPPQKEPKQPSATSKAVAKNAFAKMGMCGMMATKQAEPESKPKRAKPSGPRKRTFDKGTAVTNGKPKRFRMEPSEWVPQLGEIVWVSHGTKLPVWPCVLVAMVRCFMLPSRPPHPVNTVSHPL